MAKECFVLVRRRGWSKGPYSKIMGVYSDAMKSGEAQDYFWDSPEGQPKDKYYEYIIPLQGEKKKKEVHLLLQTAPDSERYNWTTILGAYTEKPEERLKELRAKKDGICYNIFSFKLDKNDQGVDFEDAGGFGVFDTLHEGQDESYTRLKKQ